MVNKTDLKSIPMSEALAHHGVKGMKWGVRKDGKPQGYQGADRKEGLSDRFVEDLKVMDPKNRTHAVEREDKEWKQHITTDSDRLKYTISTSEKVAKKEIKKLNKEYRRKDLSDESVKEQYAKDVADTLVDAYDYGSYVEFGLSPSGAHRVVVMPSADDPNKFHAGVFLRYNDEIQKDLDSVRESDEKRKAVKHQEGGPGKQYVRYPIEFEVDSDGLIVDLETKINEGKKVGSLELKHHDLTAVSMSDALMHHGVKGMKWGVRKSRSAMYLDRAEKGGGKKRKNNLTPAQKERIKKAKIKAKADIKVAKLNAKAKKIEARTKLESAKAKAESSKAQTEAPKKKAIKDMTNQELQEIINRNRLETEYKKISQVPKKKTTTDKIVEFAVKQGVKGAERASGALVNHIVDTQMKKIIGESFKPEDKKKKDKS